MFILVQELDVFVVRHGGGSFLVKKNRLDLHDSESLKGIATDSVRSRFSTNADNHGAGAPYAPANRDAVMPAWMTFELGESQARIAGCAQKKTRTL
jgi:hypothetical protein